MCESIEPTLRETTTLRLASQRSASLRSQGSLQAQLGKTQYIACVLLQSSLLDLQSLAALRQIIRHSRHEFEPFSLETILPLSQLLLLPLEGLVSLKKAE